MGYYHVEAVPQILEGIHLSEIRIFGGNASRRVVTPLTGDGQSPVTARACDTVTYHKISHKCDL